MKIHTQPNARPLHAGSNYRHLRTRFGNLIPLVLCISVLGLALASGGCAIAGGGGKGDKSLSVPAAPAAVTVKPGNAAVSLGWPIVTDATVYHIKRSTSASGTFTQVASSASPSYTDTGLILLCHFRSQFRGRKCKLHAVKCHSESGCNRAFTGASERCSRKCTRKFILDC